MPPFGRTGEGRKEVEIERKGTTVVSGKGI